MDGFSFWMCVCVCGHFLNPKLRIDWMSKIEIKQLPKEIVGFFNILSTVRPLLVYYRLR